jgi:hypothetical protein
MLRAIVSSLLLIGLLLHPRLIISTGGISFLASKPFMAWLVLHHPIKRPIIYLFLYLKIYGQLLRTVLLYKTDGLRRQMV